MRFAIRISLCLILPILIGCGHARTAVTSHNVLRYALDNEPTTFDPDIVPDGYTGELLQNVFEGLDMIDANNHIVPCLADRWELSSDHRTYTFHLRASVRFQKPIDRPLTAEDVKFSLERIFLPELKAPVLPGLLNDIVGAKAVMAGKRLDLEGVRVIDPHTVSITLEKPRGYFLAELASALIVCKAAVERNAGHIDEKTAIGTGPFRLAEYRHGYKVVLEANPDCWAGRPPLDRIERPIVIDSETAHTMYESNELDLCLASPVEFAQDRANPELAAQAHLFSYASTHFLAMNSRLVREFSDRRVRQAIARAIDKVDLCRIVFRGIRAPADTILPPGVVGADPNDRGLSYDPVAARALLAAAGYPGGKGFPALTLVYRQKEPTLSAEATIIRDDLKRNLGIEIGLQEREGGMFLSDAGRGKIPLFMFGISSFDPHDGLTALLRTGAPQNQFGYSSTRFDALCDRGDSEIDPNRRAHIYREADRAATQDAALVPLERESLPALIKPWVQGVETNISTGLLPHYRTRIVQKARSLR